MIRNFLKTIGRNIKRSKTFSFLNIIGLAIGIACAAIIFLWVEFYLNFNHSIKNLDNLYNVKNTQTYGKDVYTFSSTALLTKDILENKLSGVASASRYNSYGATISVGEKYTSHSGAYVDSAFMDMFDFPMVAGNRSKALNQVNQIAISEELAENYFAGQDAMSKTIMVDKQPYIVSAVFKKRLKNTSFNKVEFLIPFDVFYAPHKGKPEDIWGNNWTDTWVMLSPNVNVEKANQQLKSYIKKTYPESNNSIFLYPLNKMVLYGQFVNGKEDISSGYIKYIKMFSLIAIIILIIACINFMNLSTARSEKRSKEIGIRKVLGSSRKALVGKLLMESIAIAYISVLFAVLIIAIVLPMFNQLVHIPLKMELFKSSHLIFLVVIGFFAGILAGSYPALYLSSFNPISALKRQVYKIGGGAINIRKVLVVFQFAISIIIIFSMIVIYQQIQFSKNRDLGFNRNNILSVDLTPTLQNNFSSLKQSILSKNLAVDITESSASPMEMYSNGGGYQWKGKDENDNILITLVGTDNSYLPTFGIKLHTGRNFSSVPAQDSNNVIINRSLARLMGKEGYIGAQLRQGDGPVYTVIGITEDFVYNDMNKLKPDPLLFFHDARWFNKIYLKLKPTADLQSTLNKLEAIFKTIEPSKPFDYRFVDADFNEKFEQTQFVSTLATMFGGLAIFISCLGLFGLAAFTAEQRTKEIGVRKVLGASVSSVISLLSKDFIKLVGIACLIAFPLAYWIMNSWLQDYQYRISIYWYVYLFSGVAALGIAFLTIYFQTFRAATMNPVKSLRTE